MLQVKVLEGFLSGNDVGGVSVDCVSVKRHILNVGAMPESAMPESSMPESAMPESAMPESSMPESSMPESSMPESSMAGFKNRFSRVILERSISLFEALRSERGDVPGWVLVVLMTTGLVTGIWTLAAPRIDSILRNSLDSMGSIR